MVGSKGSEVVVEVVEMVLHLVVQTKAFPKFEAALCLLIAQEWYPCRQKPV